MSKTSQEARRALTEERGKELDKWWAINFVRFMNSQDPISPTLSDMPTEILVQVLEKLNSMEQLICRKVCRSLRSTIEKFGIIFDSILLKVWNDEVTMNLDGLDILYNDAANGTSIVTKNKKTIIKGENVMQVAFNDLRILLKHVKEFYFISYGEDEHANATYLLNVLKTNQCVYIKEIKLQFLPLVDICSILPYFDSQMLYSIELLCDDTCEHSEQLLQLEQWKNAKDCTIYGALGDNIPIQHLLHFRSINVELEEFPLQKMIEIRDNLKNTNLIEIARVFQPHYSGSEEFDIEYISNNVKFEISCGKEGVSGRMLNIRKRYL